MEDRGLRVLEDKKEWVDDISSRKVDPEDFGEVVDVLRSAVVENLF